MSWLDRVVRPKIRALVSKEAPENLWEKCPACGQMIFHRELETNQRVCTHCGHHMRIAARARLAGLFDDGVFTEIEVPKTVADPLKFRDRKRYADRLREAQAKIEADRVGKPTQSDAIIVAHGKMGGMPAVIAAFDFSFMGGSMGVAVGEGIIAAARLAVLQEAPLLVIPASGGARMQEGILSLMQMPRTTVAIDEVKEAGLPYVVLLTDPTTGGVSASFAMLGDIAIAEPGAVVGFAGKRVIEETIREKLPDGFQTAEYLLEHGMVDMVVARGEIRDTLIRLYRHFLRPNPPADIVPLAADRALATRDKAKESAGGTSGNGASAGDSPDESPGESGKESTGPKPGAPEPPAGSKTD
jgi:acetyl-CoA carboxylase carboxyl transferase subunit beta